MCVESLEEGPADHMVRTPVSIPVAKALIYTPKTMTRRTCTRLVLLQLWIAKPHHWRLKNVRHVLAHGQPRPGALDEWCRSTTLTVGGWLARGTACSIPKIPSFFGISFSPWFDPSGRSSVLDDETPSSALFGCVDRAVKYTMI